MPSAQLVHSFVTEEYTVPPPHSTGCTAPSTHTWLLGHTSHSLAPLCVMNVPAAQALHAVAPPMLKRPGAHGTLRPFTHEEPAGQLMHAVPLEYVPPAQTVPVGNDEPAIQTLPGPATHGPVHVDTVIDVVLPKRPAGHGVHAWALEVE